MKETAFQLGPKTIKLSIPETENEKLLGLITRVNQPPDDEGMGFYSGVRPLFLHTFGMLFPIDIVWLGSDGSIMGVDEHVKPGSFVNPKTPWAIEVADGWVSRNLGGTL